MSEVVLSFLKLSDIEEVVERSLARAFQSQKQSEPEQYISIASAATILAVSKVTIYHYISEGLLNKYKIGSTTRLLKSEVLSLVKKV